MALERVTAGGNWGDWLTSPLGALAMLALALAGSLQVAPRQTARGLALAGVAGIAAGRLAARRTQAALPALPMRRWPRRQGDPWEKEEPVEVEAIPVVPAVAEETAESDEGEDEEDEEEEWDEEEAAEPVPKRRRSEDGWQMPPLDLLRPDPARSGRHDSERKAHIIVEALASFGVDVAVTQINEGPTVTQFGIEPGWDVKTKTVVERDEAGRPLLDEDGRPCEREEEVGRTRVRVNRITRLANDLALALAAPSIRVEAPVPGESVIGFEVPNSEVQRVSLRGVIESAAYQKALKRGGLPIALGRDVAGKPVVVDLTLMPHLLIAGATGSGKSVCINSIIACLLMHFSPEQVRLVLADPKRVELTGYNEVPHLAFSRVVTDPEEVVTVLGIVVREMERRYLLLERGGGARHRRLQRGGAVGGAVAVLGAHPGRAGGSDDDCAGGSGAAVGARGATGPGDRDPLGDLHAAALRRCGDGADQGELPHPNRIRNHIADGLARDHGPGGGGAVAGARRHVV